MPVGPKTRDATDLGVSDKLVVQSPIAKVLGKVIDVDVDANDFAVG